mmetsp:Transcript_124799/g.278922  ORF Transcript_124799/g.278922 Transcript_124799/m.278922 type:complete len:225 (+) Transcript_124799:43-717(+)
MPFRVTSRSSVQEEDSRGDVRDQPLHTLEQTLARVGRTGEDEPVAARDLLEAEEISDFRSRKRPWQVLLVGEDEECGTGEALLLQQPGQLVTAIGKAGSVRGVYHPNEAIGGLEVVPPIAADRLLPAHIPYVQLVALILEGLDVEAKRRRHGVDGLPIELLEDGCLPCIVKAQHEQAHLLLLLLHLPQYLHQPHGGHTMEVLSKAQHSHPAALLTCRPFTQGGP